MNATIRDNLRVFLESGLRTGLAVVEALALLDIIEAMEKKS